MSVIEDSRKVIQDFIAPELRAISARLDALEQRMGLMDRRFDTVDRNIDSVDRRAEKRHDEVMAAIYRVADFNSLQERVSRLESSQSSAHQ